MLDDQLDVLFVAVASEIKWCPIEFKCLFVATLVFNPQCDFVGVLFAVHTRLLNLNMHYTCYSTAIH